MVKCPLGCFLVYSSLLVARMRESVCTNRDFSASPSVHAEIRQGCQLSDTFRVGIRDVFHCRRHKDYHVAQLDSGRIVGMWQELALLSSNKLQQCPRSKPSFERTLQQAPTASTKVVYSFGHSPFLTERDGNRDNRCCSLLIHYKRDVLLCPAERNISVILNLCLTAQAMRFAERSWILSFSLGLLLRIHPLWWKYPHDP